jgi:hypothetical protein
LDTSPEADSSAPEWPANDMIWKLTNYRQMSSYCRLVRVLGSGRVPRRRKGAVLEMKRLADVQLVTRHFYWGVLFIRLVGCILSLCHRTTFSSESQALSTVKISSLLQSTTGKWLYQFLSGETISFCNQPDLQGCYPFFVRDIRTSIDEISRTTTHS